LFSPERSRSNVLKYIAISFIIIAAFWILPFLLLDWIIPGSSNQATSFFTRAGGLSLFTIVELLKNQVTLPTSLQFLGYLWLPALLAGYYLVYRDQPRTLNELAQKGAGIMLIFFLTFSWVSEPYIIVVIALVLIFLPLSKTNFRNFHFLWVIPLIFMIVTTNFAQLFFLVSPQVIGSLAQLDQQIRTWRLIARFLVVIAWQIFAWILVIKLLNPKKNSNSKPLSEVFLVESNIIDL
jgi:carbon starvation protein CstA